MTWREIAIAAGLPEPRVRKYGEGKVAQPRDDAMLQIATVLDVNLFWLRDGVGPMRRGESPETPPESVSGDDHMAAADFGTRLRTARESRGLTVARACAGLLISHERWRAIEAGAVQPTLLELQLVSQRLTESLDWLVAGHVAAATQPSRNDPAKPTTPMLHEGPATGFAKKIG